MAASASTIHNLSPDWVEHFYSNQKYSPKPLDPFRQGSHSSTPAQKAKKIWGVQKLSLCNTTPQDSELESSSRERILKRAIPNKDGRIRIQDTTQWPYACIAQLCMKFNGQDFAGSGTMIGPHHVLTCGHNVFDETTKKWAENIKVYPAVNGTSAPFGHATVTRVYTLKKWHDSASSEHDLALLVLNLSLGKYTGWASVRCEGDAFFAKREVHIYGYPGDKGPNELWGMNDTIRKATSEEFEYVIDTYKGQSGSPIWMSDNDAPSVLGVHTHGDVAKNVGVRITEAKFKEIHAIVRDTLKLVSSPKVSCPSQQLQTRSLPIFGKELWEQLFGAVGTVPALPLDIETILTADYPFEAGFKVHQKCALILVPATIDGTPLTFDLLEAKLNTPKGGGHPQYLNLFQSSLIPLLHHHHLSSAKEKLNRVRISNSYWMIISLEPVPETDKMTFEKQATRLNLYNHQIPQLFEAVLAMGLMYAHTKTELFKTAGTRCVEKVNTFFGTEHFLVQRDSRWGTLALCNDSKLSLGYPVAAVRRFGQATDFASALT